jgi:hypothetical protein
MLAARTSLTIGSSAACTKFADGSLVSTEAKAAGSALPLSFRVQLGRVPLFPRSLLLLLEARNSKLPVTHVLAHHMS